MNVVNADTAQSVRTNLTRINPNSWMREFSDNGGISWDAKIVGPTLWREVEFCGEQAEQA